MIARAFSALALAGLALLVGQAAEPAALGQTRLPGLFTAAETVCQFDTKALPEISGLANSLVHRNTLWATNDSGNEPYLYALDATTCEIKARLRLRDTPGRDHEALAVGKDAAGRNVIWVADIGDNIKGWPYVRIHKVVEPTQLRDASVEVVTYRFTYTGGPRNAEAIMADPASERLWVVTKGSAGAAVYALPSPMSPSLTPMKAKKVGDARANVTDAAVSPNGKRYVIRDYFSAETFSGLPVGEPKARFALPLQPQGESITWSSDSGSLYIASEGSADLIKVRVPASALGADGGVAGLLPRVAGFDIYPVARVVALVAGGIVGLVVLRRMLGKAWR
ncbi:MAG: hypothetical protein ACOYEV_12415 [Candidatus Nanopelagicales bacterium]